MKAELTDHVWTVEELLLATPRGMARAVFNFSSCPPGQEPKLALAANVGSATDLGLT